MNDNYLVEMELLDGPILVESKCEHYLDGYKYIDTYEYVYLHFDQDFEAIYTYVEYDYITYFL